MHPGKLPFVGFLCWLMLLTAGMAAMLAHDYATAESGLPPVSRPIAGVPIPTGHLAIIMFAHPQCPCTRASLTQLADLLGRISRPVTAQVFFYSPVSQPESWVKAENWRAAAAIPGIHLQRDPEGALAAQFGAVTSGHTVVYDANGNLVFAGGLTASRGQSGASMGGEAMLKAAAGEVRGLVKAPAFGCSIRGVPTNSE